MALFFGLAVKEITEALCQEVIASVNKAINPLIGTFGGVVGPIVMYFIVISIQQSMGVPPQMPHLQMWLLDGVFLRRQIFH